MGPGGYSDDMEEEHSSVESRRTAPQHRVEIIDDLTDTLAMDRSPYSFREPCKLCAKLPVKHRGLLNSTNIRDELELWEYLDREHYNHLLRKDRDHEREARVERKVACVAAEKARKHLRKLQKDLLERGLIKEMGQKFIGERDEARWIAPFYMDEIVCGRKIGSGGFSAVYEIDDFRRRAALQSGEYHELEDAARDFVTTHVRRKADRYTEIGGLPKQQYHQQSEERSASYAVKHLKYSLVEDPDKFEKAAVDLALEGQLLLVLDHPHIISLRGWARGGTDAFLSGSPSSYFLILDRLPDILDRRLCVWRESFLKYKARMKLPWLRTKFLLKVKKLYIERISVAHDVASAIEHMHDRHIINRDLKTSNIGFDTHGEVKIFDLGLSRLMPKEKYKLEEGYIMSRVGTKATMAPEVRRRQPYDESADVYSFGIVLWEITALSTSNEYLRSLKKRERKRFEVDEEFDVDGFLPLPICPCWPLAIQDLIHQCLKYDPKARPSMAQVRRVLRDQMEALGVIMAAKCRRRSTFRLDLSKTSIDGIDEFSRTSVATSLREPLSSTDFRPYPSTRSHVPASPTGTSPENDFHASAGSVIGNATPLESMLPALQTDTSSERRCE